MKNALTDYLPHPLTSVLFIVFVLIFFFRSNLQLLCADTGWHVAAGDLIWEHKSIPTQSSWSFNTLSYEWMNISWLWDLWLSLLHRLSNNFVAPLVFNILFNALTLSLVFERSLRRHAAPLACLLLAPWAIITFSHGLALRPHQMTFFFTLALIAVLDFSNLRLSIKGALCALIMLLWVNTHGGFLLGFIIAASFAISSLLSRKIKLAFSQLLMIVPLILASLCNPLGIKVYEAALRTLSGPLQTIIAEWMPPDRRYVLHYIFPVTAAVSSLLLPLKQRRWFNAEELLTLLFFLLSCKSVRHLPLVVCAGLMPGSTFLTQKLHTFLHDRLEQDYLVFSSITRRIACCWAATICALLIGIAGYYKLIRAEIPESEYPMEEISYLKQNYSDARLLNFYFDGGYLIYIARGAPQIFIDGRAETAYPPEVIADYLKFWRAEPGWEIILDKYKITATLLPNEKTWVRYFESHSNWTGIALRTRYKLFVRKK